MWFQPSLPTQVSACPYNLVFPAAKVSKMFLSAVSARRTAPGSVCGDPEGAKDTLCCWPSAVYCSGKKCAAYPFQAPLLIASGL